MSEKKGKIAASIRNSAVIKNPVLFEAIGIAPVVAMATSLKSSIMLAAVSVTELIIIESFACLLLKKLKSCFRVLIYAVLGVLINIPFFMLFEHFAPNETANVSIFLPVIAVNSLIALHCERVAVRNSFKATFLDSVSAGIGYVFVIFTVGIVREIIGSGTVYGFSLSLPVKLSGLTLPFGGFLVLGFLAALFKGIIAKKYPNERPEAAFNLSEISDSHIDKLKNLIDNDFNPFDELAAKEDEQPEISLRPASPKREKTAKPEKKERTKQVKEKKGKTKAKADKDSGKPKSEKSVPAERQSGHRTYVSEFDDILNDINKDTASSENSEKGGDEE